MADRHLTRVPAQHTPGPWTVGRGYLRGMKASIEALGTAPDTRLIIAHVDNVDGFRGETDANARLIAAAPGMAALLADTIRRWDTDETSTDIMDDFVAIARALLARIETAQP
jgi:hypothetical protein